MYLRNQKQNEGSAAWHCSSANSLHKLYDIYIIWCNELSIFLIMRFISINFKMLHAQNRFSGYVTDIHIIKHIWKIFILSAHLKGSLFGFISYHMIHMLWFITLLFNVTELKDIRSLPLNLNENLWWLS